MLCTTSPITLFHKDCVCDCCSAHQALDLVTVSSIQGVNVFSAHQALDLLTVSSIQGVNGSVLNIGSRHCQQYSRSEGIQCSSSLGSRHCQQYSRSECIQCSSALDLLTVSSIQGVNGSVLNIGSRHCQQYSRSEGIQCSSSLGSRHCQQYSRSECIQC